MTTLRNENLNTQPDAADRTLPGDQVLTILGIKFAIALMDERSKVAAIPAGVDLATEEALTEAAIAPTLAIVAEIDRRTATTLEGHMVKALVRRWEEGYAPAEAA